MENNSLYISAIMPVYNEKDSVVNVVTGLTDVLSASGLPFEIILVDDGSTDGSSSIISSLKGIVQITHPYNRGYGAALKTGIKAAKGTHILIIDCDGTYPTDAIPALLENIPAYDMAVGSRTGNIVNVPFMRRPAKFILTHFANFIVGKRIPDLNSGLRIFRKDIALRFFSIFPQGFSFTTTITLACLTKDYTVKYIPINYYKRKGKSTIHPIKDFGRFVMQILRMALYFNPLKIFSLMGIALFLLAFLVFLYSNLFLNKIFDTTVLVILIASMQTFFFGLLAELIIKERRNG